VRAGTLRHQVKIQERVIQQDPVTGAAREFYRTKYEGVPAAIEPISGREFLSADQVRAEVRAKITIRSGLDTSPKDRVLFQSRAYDIQAVLDDPTFKRHQELMCSEGVRRDGETL
jgi:SPP1 family predicted phage head-tail adaptor